ncbi:B3/B4 domain-containing protein [Metaclostridioides mangenotii]|uniref:DNA/RNA-binding domain of Phe-tRNA-synthetase-like protein n=1 Tax=Metaclostridioides mangenotii TaxID=1540 RepID=A0ABS4E7K3_9FIRM|nr:phenylalanine--tRNA ligase beta subunit-related protein [Clostridioides mangenotii]MBP1853914.1 DNA/RNA-binding domain of Phe-tRNA-synthetase-like protein [Clostridioides mangenotii]
MKFKVDKEVFDKLENVCFGVVVAKGIDNTKTVDRISNLLDISIENTENYFEGKKVKESDEILPYRDAFRELGINPNKFMSSIEAMTTRVSKNKKLPYINPVVDLGNSISLKYLLPLGAHDMDLSSDDVSVRFSKEGDKFIPFGENEPELIEGGELIYSVGEKVKTRRWIWRQGEEGKITESSKNIFFPIDGFNDRNVDKVIKARDELAKLIQEIFECEVEVGFVDKDNMEFEIN